MITLPKYNTTILRSASNWNEKAHLISRYYSVNHSIGCSTI